MVRVELHPATEDWPRRFERERRRIVAALGATAASVHHTGSTSVPGLMAKPVIDITLVVPDSTDENAYVPPLVGIGYEFYLREPEWYEHRLFRMEDPRVNLHVFSVGCEEIDRMLAFRDHLRVDSEDRRRYESVKLALTEREWPSVQDYADAKSDVIAEIMLRARPR